MEGLGPKISIGIVDQEENKMIKYGAENIPIPLNAWIQLKQVEELDTRMRITVKTDMPAMFRMMFENFPKIPLNVQLFPGALSLNNLPDLRPSAPAS